MATVDLSRIRCEACGNVFNSGFKIVNVPSVVMTGNKSRCPRCGTWASLPDGTFRANAEGLLEFLASTPDRRRFTEELLQDLRRAQSTGEVATLAANKKYESIARWLPNTPEKLAVYIALLQLMLQLLSRDPHVTINVNQVVNQVNVENVQNIDARRGR